MHTDALISELNASEEFFERSSRSLSEQDSEFRPVESMWTVAQQVSHVAQTIDWFVEGASRPEGFDLDFEKLSKASMGVTSLSVAREWLKKSYEAARKFFGSLDGAALQRPLPPGPVMGGVPIAYVAQAISEHSAHHRGALTVYARLLGQVPKMPYME